jgi:hypothetical protein
MVRQSGVSLAALRSALVGLPPCGEPSSRYHWHGNHMYRTSKCCVQILQAPNFLILQALLGFARL